METTMIDLRYGDCLEVLRELAAGSVQCCVTSPPYYGLRVYTDDPREIGNEPTPAAYVAALVAVFDEVRRVLRDDGTLWINLGDAYANDTKWGGTTGGKHARGLHGTTGIGRGRTNTGLPSKSLIGIPWRVAFALQEAGWVLRNDIIWHKPACMPENVTDRCARNHEYLFLFSKQPQYYFDHEAIREESAPSSQARARYNNGHASPKSKAGAESGVWGAPVSTKKAYGQGHNKPTVWSIPLRPLRDAHYAAFPEGLVEPCIRAGSRPGDTVLDPFVGSGTTCRVAESLGRDSIGIDLAYQDLQMKRTDNLQIDMEAFL
jgi:DNA modification methylase